MLLYLICIVIIIMITAFFIVFANDSDSINTEFLSSYGWIVSEKPIEYERFVLNIYEDETFHDYNAIQKEIGLDLTPYYGKEVERFTYSVLNYPNKNVNNVRANVLCYESKPIAGDIMTVASDGFMHSLKFPEIN